MRKHFQKWHPGQPVMLIMQPDFYDVHTKDAKHAFNPDADGGHSGAKVSLEKDANVVQVF